MILNVSKYNHNRKEYKIKGNIRNQILTISHIGQPTSNDGHSVSLQYIVGHLHFFMPRIIQIKKKENFFFFFELSIEILITNSRRACYIRKTNDYCSLLLLVVCTTRFLSCFLCVSCIEFITHRCTFSIQYIEYIYRRYN